MSIRAIQTEYNNYSFRSRLEARWAVFFDTLGVRYEYEKEGFHLTSVSYTNHATGYRGILIGDVYYLPDFYLPDHSIWVEIKGASCSDDDMHKCRLLQANKKQCVYVVQGEIGFHHWVNSNIVNTDSFMTNYVKIKKEVRFSHLLEPVGISNRNSSAIIRCINCGSDQVFIVDSSTYCFDPEMEVNWAGDSDAVNITIECEICGSVHLVCLKTRKGQTFITVDSAFKPLQEVCSWLAGDDEERRIAAIKAARSARFEHGETPKVQRGRIKKGK